MRSKPVALLLSDLGVTKTHSRPYVSNDNPYSESQFKTMKYCPQFPSHFGSAEDGRLFCCGFFDYYNFHHRHSGIGLMTPADVHYGRAEQLTTARRQILLEAQQAHPERFVRGTPQPPVLPPQAWINPPLEKTTLHNAAQAPLAAASIPGVPPFSASRNEILVDVDVDHPGSHNEHLFTRELGLAAARGGLGHGGNDHADDEYIVVGRQGRVAGIVEAEASMVDILMTYAAL